MKFVMKLRLKTVLGLLLLPFLGLAMLFIGITDIYAQTPAEVERGKQVYSQNCQGCHGDQGQGVRGPRVAGYDKGATTLLNKVRGNPRGNMPVFPAERVSDADVTAIHSFVRSLGAPATGQGGGGTTAPTTLPAAGTGGLTSQTEGFNFGWLVAGLGLLAGASGGWYTLRVVTRKK
jgi:mono/diheme cytochrome c family protein